MSSTTTNQMLASNSPHAIQQRIQSGCIGWAGPLILTTARTGLILLVQAAVATVFLIRGDSSPWRAQAPWWTVYATLVDIGCLLLLWRQSRREGIRLSTLFGIQRSRLGREVLWGLLYFVILFPIVAGLGSKLAGWLVYRTMQLTPAMLAPGLLSERQLPHWAVIYSLSVFWLVWSPTEEVIYQAYCATRLQVLTGSTWVTVMWVGFWWAFQHSVFPLVFDWRLVVFRFLQFLPLVVVFQLIYLRTRCLPRMIILHWPMDLFAAVLTLRL
jgi:Type II CAAX prenyl endopeptidase Rce1-like